MTRRAFEFPEVEFKDVTPKTPQQLERLKAAYLKAFGYELPKSVELAANAIEEDER